MQIGIAGEAFTVDGVPTHAGRSYRGRSIEGVLFCVRAAQATFDDENWPATRRYEIEGKSASFAYPDTGAWDADRNTAEFCATLPDWRAHGVNTVVLAFQGGRPVRDVWKTRCDAQPWINSGFAPDGALKPAYAARMARCIAAADALGMVAVVSFFYFGQSARLRDEEAVRRAVREGTAFLAGLPHRNVLLEIAQEVAPDWQTYHYLQHRSLALENIHHHVRHAKEVAGGALLVSTSLQAPFLPTPELVRTADFVLPHGNNLGPAGHLKKIEAIRAMPAYRDAPKPIFFNEASADLADLQAALSQRVSWSFYDHGSNDYADGFQSPPVQWRINTPRKAAFFERIADITGAGVGGGGASA
jgi:hypothetical protein